MLSSFRPYATIVSVTSNEIIERQLALVWGVEPLVIRSQSVKTVDEAMRNAITFLKKQQLLKASEKVVCVFGEKLGVTAGTNTIRVITVV